MNKEYFSLLLPPPNLTGVLHLGHMGNAILQDVLVRYYKSKNTFVYWGFGLDHAGLSLQIKVESELQKQGISKRDLSEDEFNRALGEGKEKHEDIILDQYRELSLELPLYDKYFTLDENSKKSVLSVFRRLYKDGLIYRAERLINGDMVMQTAISDIEVIYKTEEVELYYLKYFLVEEKDKYLEVATTRLETIFGDVALFVNPEDKRYKEFVGKMVYIPYLNRKIPVLQDSYIDMEFGTGVMKCTPAHDFCDGKLGKKYSLEVIKVFDELGRMYGCAGEFRGLLKDDCKQRLKKILLEKEILTIGKFITNISYSERTNSKIEPMISKQGFLKSSLLADNALNFLENNPDSIIFYPEKARDGMKQHLKNTEDGCISRQLEWGIKIPIGINRNSEKYSLEMPSDDLEDWELSSDVLDTGFSSALWPLIVFRQIGERIIANSFFPVSLLISGKDILFFGISRMIFFSVYLVKNIPFKKIYLHGLILDSQNRKMSKSLNNGVLPGELIDKFGNDVSRLFFLLNTNFDKNISFSWEKLEYSKKFLHKLENISKFLKLNYPKKLEDLDFKELNGYEFGIGERLMNLIGELDRDFSDLKFSQASKKIINFLGDDFCNTYVEFFKLSKKLKNLEPNSISFIFYIGKEILRTLYPFFPNFSCDKFLEIYGVEISFKEKDLPISLGNNNDYEGFFKYLNMIRHLYSELKIGPNIKMYVRIVVPKGQRDIFKKNYSKLFPFFALINQKVNEVGESKSREKSLSILLDNLLFEIHSDGLNIDSFLIQVEKLKKEKRSEVERAKKILGNESFCSKAPEYLIKQEREKLERYKKELIFYENI